jgi:hypothetical protein
LIEEPVARRSEVEFAQKPGEERAVEVDEEVKVGKEAELSRCHNLSF